MRKQVIAKLNQIANEFDKNGLYVEANTLTNVMRKIALDENDEYNIEDYFPYGDPDGDDDDDEDLDEGFDEKTPKQSGSINVHNIGGRFIVNLSINNILKGEYVGTDNEEGEFKRFESGDEANRFAISLKVQHPDVNFRVNLYDRNRRRYTGDPGAEAYERDRDRRSSY